MSTTNLSLIHLRFDCIARQPIMLGREAAGERLRNALASVMLRTVCPERVRGREATPEHAAICPVCWLLAANVDPGKVRRAYSVVPPLPGRDVVEVGETFSFVLTLFGEGINFLPYFVLAVPEMGASGVGPGRGKFELSAISALDPFSGRSETVLAPGEQMIFLPQRAISWDGVLASSDSLLPVVEGRGLLKLRFLTPTRLVTGNLLLKTPDFGVLFQRLLHRIDELGQQFAGDVRRSHEEIMALQQLANEVRLIESNVRWVELFSYSGRTKKKSPMGGFMGTVSYVCQDWAPLLPFLLWGQATQMGKLVVKGNGVFEVGEGKNRYWYWLFGAG